MKLSTPLPRLAVGLLFCVAPLFAAPPQSQLVDIPLHNWTVPRVVATQQESTAPGGFVRADEQGHRSLTPQTNIVPAAVPYSNFVALTPCRMYDTRSFGPATPLAGGSSITVNPNGVYPTGFTPCSGIPGTAAAYSINITVFGSAANGSFAFLTAYPTGTTRPAVSTMNFSTGSQTSNAAIITAGTSGSFDVYTTYTTNFTIDINGYFLANDATTTQTSALSGSFTTTGTTPLNFGGVTITVPAAGKINVTATGSYYVSHTLGTDDNWAVNLFASTDPTPTDFQMYAAGGTTGLIPAEAPTSAGYRMPFSITKQFSVGSGGTFTINFWSELFSSANPTATHPRFLNVIATYENN